jgi:tetratricopeptide (TPR) repeat protein
VTTAGDLLAAGRTALAQAALRTGDYENVALTLERALRAAKAAGDLRAEAAVMAQQGMLLHFQAIDLPADERATIDHGPEQELFERALAIRREEQDDEGIAESLWQLGLVHQVLRRDLETGSPYVREALVLVERLPDCDPWLRSEIHRHVGFDLLLREERYEDALDHFRTSLELREALEERGWTAGGLTALSAASRRAGLRAEAIDYARRAVEVARAEGLRERHLAAAEEALGAAEEPGADGLSA